MRFFLFTAGCLRWTYFNAQTAAGAFFRINAVGNERFTDARGTAVIFDVRFILFPEISDGAQNRIGSTAAQRTK